MKWLRIFILVVILSILIPSGMVLAASPSVDNVKVFQGYMEPDDWLIVCVYNISGTNASTSLCNPYTYPWRIQLLDGSTLLYDGKIKQCGMRPQAIYFSAAQVSSYSWGLNYSVKIIASWGNSSNASRTINSTDWIGTDLTQLDGWVRYYAQVMEDFDTKDYITSVPEFYEVLTIDGGSIFDLGIPYLSYYRPDIFQVTTYTYPIGYVPSNGSTSYADNLYTNWATTLGPDVSGALTTVAPYFGFTSGRMVGALLTVMGFLSLAIIEKSVAFMIILGGVLIGVLPMATIIMLVFILAIVLIRSLFWSST
jgi:hypothetical protein